MNRPFYAFGTLLVALALTLIAVGSAKRSTTVRPQAETSHVPQAAKESTSDSTTPRRPGNIFVVVLPEAGEESHLAASNTAELNDPCAFAQPQPSYATGCGLDRLTGRIYAFATDDRAGWHFDDDCRQAWSPLAPRNDTLIEETAPSQIVTAIVEFATHDAAVSHEFSNSTDFYSHYDPIYDRAVYGEERSWTARLNGWISWFHGLEFERKLAHVCMTLSGWRDRLSAARARLTSDEISWEDYAELLDAAVANRDAAVDAAESTTAVRSSRWLLRFAASSLNRASSVLNALADELNRTAADTETDQLAGERASSQR